LSRKKSRALRINFPMITRVNIVTLQSQREIDRYRNTKRSNSPRGRGVEGELPPDTIPGAFVIMPRTQGIPLARGSTLTGRFNGIGYVQTQGCPSRTVLYTPDDART
jgi:hypothetical protein